METGEISVAGVLTKASVAGGIAGGTTDAQFWVAELGIIKPINVLKNLEGVERDQATQIILIPQKATRLLQRLVQQIKVNLILITKSFQNPGSKGRKTGKILYFENFDLNSVVTPVDADALERLLNETHYDINKTKYLVNGFRNGFSLGYCGPKQVQRLAPNLKLTVGDEIDLWNKVMKEVKLKRFAGPFKQIPFENYIQSPIGLVSKDNGRDTRLIFHLSYPRNNLKQSVNANTPQEFCKVQYPDFAEAIRLCLEEGEFCFVAKSDMRSAFRNLGILGEHQCYLVMKAKSPFDGLTYYFVDKCLPFGSSISCAIFQSFSDCVAHIVQYKNTTCQGKKVINYLDDFFLCCFTEIPLQLSSQLIPFNL